MAGIFILSLYEVILNGKKSTFYQYTSPMRAFLCEASAHIHVHLCQKTDVFVLYEFK